MSKITINDLVESKELDRKAMTEVVGGRRRRRKARRYYPTLPNRPSSPFTLGSSTLNNPL